MDDKGRPRCCQSPARYAERRCGNPGQPCQQGCALPAPPSLKAWVTPASLQRTARPARLETEASRPRPSRVGESIDAASTVNPRGRPLAIASGRSLHWCGPVRTMGHHRSRERRRQSASAPACARQGRPAAGDLDPPGVVDAVEAPQRRAAIALGRTRNGHAPRPSRWSALHAGNAGPPGLEAGPAGPQFPLLRGSLAHVLRHSYATLVVDNGALLSELQRLLGRRDMFTTQVYSLCRALRLVQFRPGT